jgi:hypothetical protein
MQRIKDRLRDQVFWNIVDGTNINVLAQPLYEGWNHQPIMQGEYNELTVADLIMTNGQWDNEKMVQFFRRDVMM